MVLPQLFTIKGVNTDKTHGWISARHILNQVNQVSSAIYHQEESCSAIYEASSPRGKLHFGVCLSKTHNLPLLPLPMRKFEAR